MTLPTLFPNHCDQAFWQLVEVVHIPQKFTNHRRITGGDPTRAEDNPCVIIRRLSAMTSVRHNQETNNPPHNCQVHHIGCICVLPDAPLGLPIPRILMLNILTLTVTDKGVQKSRPNNQTSESYTSKYIPPHIQAEKHTSEHSYRPTGCRRIFFRIRSCEYSTTPKGENKRTHILQKGGN